MLDSEQRAMLKSFLFGGLATAGVFALIMLGLALTAGSASAQQLCLERDVAVAQLTKQHGENVTGRGLATNGKYMVELYTAEDGSWTLITTDISGRSCVVASGEAWTPVSIKLGNPASYVPAAQLVVPGSTSNSFPTIQAWVRCKTLEAALAAYEYVLDDEDVEQDTATSELPVLVQRECDQAQGFMGINLGNATEGTTITEFAPVARDWQGDPVGGWSVERENFQTWYVIGWPWPHLNGGE